MTPARKRRLMLVVFIVACSSLATGLILNAFQKNILFFFTPTQVVAGEVPDGAVFRIGGLVAEGSVTRDENDLDVRFEVTDTREAVLVKYSGILPDLFEEGQGIVVKGRMSSGGVLVASEVLAKHDETYMPPPAADALEAARTLEYP